MYELKKEMVIMASHTFYARGSPKIMAAHRTTLEITTEEIRSRRGDCIVATCAEVGLSSLPDELKSRMRTDGNPIVLKMEAAGEAEVVKGEGDSRLTLSSDCEMVARKGDYVCGRTMMVRADKAAADLRRGFVSLLKDPNMRIKITISSP